MVFIMNKILNNQTDEFKQVFKMLNDELFAEDVKIVKKSKFLTFFVRKGFTITLRNAIKIDTKKQLSIGTLFHEAQHYMDQCRYDEKDGLYHRSLWGAIKFYTKYTFPQNIVILSLFSLLAIPFSNFFLLFLFGLLGLIPSPKLTKSRVDFELRGYFWSWLIDERRRFSKTFGGSSYYYMDEKRSEKFYQKVFEGYRIMIKHNQYHDMKRLYKEYLKLKI